MLSDWLSLSYLCIGISQTYGFKIPFILINVRNIFEFFYNITDGQLFIMVFRALLVVLGFFLLLEFICLYYKTLYCCEICILSFKNVEI